MIRKYTDQDEFCGLHCTTFLNQTNEEIQFVTQARQSLIVRGLFPMLADPRHPVSFFFGNSQF